MSGLLSASQLGALSKLVKRGMTTEATIYDRVVNVTIDGSSETWAPRPDTVQCWVLNTPQTSLVISMALQGTANLVRIYFPLGTDLKSGGRVKVAGIVYTIIDTTSDNTIQAMITVIVRSLD